MTTNKPFVTSEELVARGISADAQRKARYAAELPFTVVGADRFAYLESDVSAWIEAARNQQAESRKAIAKYAASKREQTPTAAPPPNRKQSFDQSSARALWTAAVQQKIESGMQRDAAVRAVDAERPGLRQRMLDEVNR